MSNYVAAGRYNGYHSKQDPSKTGHRTIYKEECNAKNCQSTNCSKTHKECDQASKKVFAVGHRTHDDKNASPTSKTVAFEGDKGSRGPAKCVVYEKKELVKKDLLYEDHDYEASRLLQKDENTKKLNKLTKNQKADKQNHDEEE